MMKHLQYVLSTVNEWLKFAERKNAALLAADSAAVTALLKLLEGKTILNLIDPFPYIGLGFLILSMVCCLASFFPQLKAKRSGRKDNVIFYGDLANYSVEKLLNETRGDGGKHNSLQASVEKHYADQIIINSSIAVRKYRLFKIALLSSTGALLIVLFRLGATLF